MENLTPNIGTIEQGIYNLGEIKKNSSKTFRVLLRGTQVSNLRAGCSSCTKATSTQTEEGAEIQIIYTALDAKGIINKSVTLTDQNAEKLRIQFTAKVI